MAKLWFSQMREQLRERGWALCECNTSKQMSTIGEILGTWLRQETLQRLYDVQKKVREMGKKTPE